MRVTIFIVLVAGVLFCTFFFYGSSSHLDPKKYNKLVTFKEVQPAVGDTISIMSYNIGYMSGMTNNRPIERNKELLNENLQRSIDFIGLLHPSIIGFQEIDYDSYRSLNINQLDKISSSCNYFNSHNSINWDKKYVPFPYFPISSHFRKVLSGQSVISDFPIISGDRIVLDKPENTNFFYNSFYIDRLLQITELQVKEKKVFVMNVHLEAYDIETREKQARVVLEYYDRYSTRYPTLLIGDFNARPYNKQQTDSTFNIVMSSKNIAHAFDKSDFESNPEKFYTFNSIDPTHKIDYIFYTPEYINPVDYKVLNEMAGISDHLPILFSFTLN